MAPPALATVGLFGFDFVNEHDMRAVVGDVLRGTSLREDRLPLVLTPNVDYLVRLAEPRHSALRQALRRSAWVLPDGQPIVWASRLGGRPLAARLPGSSLFPELWRSVVAERRRAVAVVSDQQVGDALRRELPTLGVVTPPMFAEGDVVALTDVVENCWSAIEAVDAEFVFVGISFPKQQFVALGLIERARVEGRRPPIFLTLGASFDMYLGLQPRAPLWMQRAGLEWLFRFGREPQRLFRRYFVTDTRFLVPFWREVFRLRRARRTVAR